MDYRKAEIRPFRDEDEPILFGLVNLDRGADERTLGVLASETVFVAELEGAPAGYVALEHEAEADAVKVDQLFVSPEHEAEGIGRQLLEFAEGYAIWQGAATLRVVVEQTNARARDFYGARGFVSISEELLELVLPQRS